MQGTASLEPEPMRYQPLVTMKRIAFVIACCSAHRDASSATTIQPWRAECHIRLAAPRFTLISPPWPALIHSQT
jgi:hypothetical protein